MVSPLRARSEALALCHDDGRSATCWLGSPRGAVSGPAPELLYAIDHRVQPCVRGLREVAEAGAELILLNPVFDEAEQMERLVAEVMPKLS